MQFRSVYGTLRHFLKYTFGTWMLCVHHSRKDKNNRDRQMHYVH
jgi:hypothetical protein